MKTFCAKVKLLNEWGRYNTLIKPQKVSCESESLINAVRFPPHMGPDQDQNIA